MNYFYHTFLHRLIQWALHGISAKRIYTYASVYLALELQHYDVSFTILLMELHIFNLRYFI